MKVSLLTGSVDPHYQLDLLQALSALTALEVEAVVGDTIADRVTARWESVKVLNLRGDQNPYAGNRVKVIRVVLYYFRLLSYSVRTHSQIFHIQWPNKFVYIDRTFLNLFYKLLGKKLIVTAHNVNAGPRDGNDSLFNRITLRFQYGLADHIIVHTEDLKSQLIETFQQPANKVSVIRHGINTAVLKDTLTTAEAREQMGFTASDKVLLFFGNIAPYKGLDVLIDSIARLDNQRDRVRLIVAGRVKRTSTYWETVRRRIDQLGLAENILERVDFIPDDDIEILFRGADCLVLPYRSCTQSGPLFIAYAYGLPVIASNVGSFARDIIPGVTGFLFASGDAVDLQITITRFFESGLYQDPVRSRNRISDFGKANYSWDKIAEETVDVYRHVCGIRGGASAFDHAQ